jgi:hypothetical protein
MPRVLSALACLLVAATASFAGFVTAPDYPLFPPRTSVRLAIESFIQSVPQQSPGLPNPNPVIGDDLGQHPGAFAVGFPPIGSFFVGVFGRPIDTANPGAAIYLWETTAPDSGFQFGPTIEVGFWDGAAFLPSGIPQTAGYRTTGFPDTAGIREITSSVTPLSNFGIALQYPGPLNAVRISATSAGAHNQVTAIAATIVIPEPGTAVFGLALSAVCASRRIRSRKRAAKVDLLA